MLFEVNLIKVPSDISPTEKEELGLNCTHVKGRIWIFEGELFALDCRFEHLDTGVVGSLGGLSQDELIKICLESFDCDSELFNG